MWHHSILKKIAKWIKAIWNEQQHNTKWNEQHQHRTKWNEHEHRPK